MISAILQKKTVSPTRMVRNPTRMMRNPTRMMRNPMRTTRNLTRAMKTLMRTTRRLMRQMFTSANSKFYMVNIQTKQFQEAKPTEEPYTGFLMFAQKYCGADFINKMNEGDVTVDFYDQSDLLIPLAVFKRDDDNKSATVQFKVNKENGAQDEGNKNMDKFYLSINGFGNVEWGKKKFDECINNMQIGATGGDYEGDLGCIAFAKTIR